MTEYQTPSASAMPCEGTVRLARGAFLNGEISFDDACAIAGRDIRKAQGKVPAADFPTCGCRNMGGASGSFHKMQQLVNDGKITEEERAAMSRGVPSGEGKFNLQLNPDWVEWLMGWAIGWTDLKVENDALGYIEISEDPANLNRADHAFIPRVTDRRDQRRNRIEELGNGQVPECAAAAFDAQMGLIEGFYCGMRARQGFHK